MTHTCVHKCCLGILSRRVKLMNPNLQVYEDSILTLLSEGRSYDDISEYLRRTTGETQGLSARSIRHYCYSRGVRVRPLVDQPCLDRIVMCLVGRVGHSYGRRTMHGLLHSVGVRACQARVARSLSRVAPIQYASRQSVANRLLNPFPYSARFFGEKLHMDQNEKCVMFGVTHVLAVDGHNRKIVGFITLPKKNPILIYDLLFRPLLQTYGLWEQVRIDHGTEFALVVTAQQHLSVHRQRHSREPVIRSLSRLNHRAERIWVEINQRVNYPLKQVLVQMENNEEINMGDEITKFCVSWVTISIMTNAIRSFIQAWNCHRIPGPEGGVPNTLAAQRNHITPLSSNIVPSTQHMVGIHEEDGLRLQRDASYGTDPLCGNIQLQQLRERDFFAVCPDLDAVFQDILHGQGHLFRVSINHFLSLTNQFSLLLS